MVRLVYGSPDRSGAGEIGAGGTVPGRLGTGRDVGPEIAGKLELHGFTAEVTRDPTGTLVCVTGRLDGAPGRAGGASDPPSSPR